MEPLRCLILDDEPLAHKVILQYADDIDYIDIVAQAYLPTEAMHLLKKVRIDLIFLDIQMPKLNGLDMLRLLDDPPEVIITSAYEEYALESYDLNVCDYLLKPFRFDRFYQATEKVLARRLRAKRTESPKYESILIKSDKRLVRIRIEDITHIQSYGNYVKVWTGKQFHLTPKTMSSLLTDLPSSLFIQIHKSFILNMDHLKYIEGNMAVLMDDTQLSISKHFKKDLLKVLGDR